MRDGRFYIPKTVFPTRPTAMNTINTVAGKKSRAARGSFTRSQRILYISGKIAKLFQLKPRHRVSPDWLSWVRRRWLKRIRPKFGGETEWLSFSRHLPVRFGGRRGVRHPQEHLDRLQELVILQRQDEALQAAVPRLHDPSAQSRILVQVIGRAHGWPHHRVYRGVTHNEEQLEHDFHVCSCGSGWRREAPRRMDLG